MNKIVAHRGWSSRAPENSFSAIELALAEKRIDAIELDIHITKDEVVVVNHDFSIERTSNGIGQIKDLTYQDLLSYDFGSWFSDIFAGERIVALDKVLDLVNHKKELIIEIKKAGDGYPNISQKLAKLISNYGYETVYVKSFNHDVIKELAEVNPSIRTGLLFYGKPTLLMDQLNYTGASFISIHHDYITIKIVEELNQSGIKIMAWTVNSKEDISKVRSISKDIYLISDYPEKAFDLRK